MSDGNTNETLVAQKDEEIAKLKEEVEKANGRVENAQAKIHDWEAEVGDNRKAAADGAQTIVTLSKELLEANKALKGIGEKMVKAQEELSELKTQHKGPQPDDGKTQQKKKTVSEQIEEFEQQLSEDDMKRLDEAVENADETTQKQINAGGVAYFELLQGLKAEKDAALADLPPWRRNTPSQNAGNSGDSALKTKIRALFTQEKKSAERYPAGPDGGASNKDKKRRPAQKRTAAWIEGSG